MHDILDTVPRSERRKLLRWERKRRGSGAWGPWETKTLPPALLSARGWLSQVTTVHRNRVFSVLDRALSSGHRHLAIASLSQERPSWWEMQRIKDELAGKEATGVEVYPPNGEIVDGANMYHLWIVPAPLPFGLWQKVNA